MKLRTKFQDEDFELGEVADVDIATMPDGSIKVQSIAERGGLHTFFYKTKAEFDANWEDAPEEPKDFWYIDEEGVISNCDYAGDNYDKNMQAIGNFFETGEKAKKAVDKLKAWQRLKDKGFRFKGWDWEDDPSKIEIKFRCPDESCLSLFDIQDDLDLLYSGGEE